MKNLKKILMISLLSFTAISAEAKLPMLGVNFKFNNTSLLLLPRSSEAIFYNFKFDTGQKGVEYLAMRDQSDSFPVLLQLLKDTTGAGNCNSKIENALQQPQFAELKPFVFFDDELDANTLKCLKAMTSF